MPKTIEDLDNELIIDLKKWLLEQMIPELHIERLKAKQLTVEGELQATGAMREGDQPLSAKYQAKGDARVLEETIKGLQAEVQKLRGELAQARTDLGNALQLVKDANAATRAELSNYLPKSGGTITGGLVVEGSVSAPSLKVGNIYGHRGQHIELSRGDDKVYFNNTIHAFKHLEVEGEADIVGGLKERARGSKANG